MNAIFDFFFSSLMLLLVPFVLVVCIHFGLKMLPGVGIIYKLILKSGPVKRLGRGFVKRRKLFFKWLGGRLHAAFVWVGVRLWRGVQWVWVRLTA